jgi:hypothetical protein
MNQKGSTKIIIIILVVILAAVVGYLTLIKKPTPPATTNQIPPTNTQIEQTQPTTSPTPEERGDIAETFKKEFEKICPGGLSYYSTTHEGFIEGIIITPENPCLIKTKPNLFIDKFLEQFSASFGVKRDQLKFVSAMNLRDITVVEYKRQINNIDIIDSFINFQFSPPFISEGEASVVVGEEQAEQTQDIYFRGVSSRLHPEIDENFPTIPKISEKELKQIIKNEENKRGITSYNFENKGLFILPKGFITDVTPPKLAYVVLVTDTPGYSYTYYVDAITGEVLFRESNIIIN